MLTVTVMGRLRLFALSTAVCVTVWPASSFVDVTGAGHVRMRLPPSLQVKVTVTSVLFHPAGFGVGVMAALMVGRTVSSPRFTESGVVPPPFVPTIERTCIPSGPRSNEAIDHTPLLIVADCVLTVTLVAVPEPPDKLTMCVLTYESGCGEGKDNVGGGMSVTVTRALLESCAPAAAPPLTVSGGRGLR